MASFTNIENTASEELQNFARLIVSDLKQKVQSAGAFRFAEISFNNFGFSGEDRPEVWPILSASYAKEFHGGQRIPTLQLTGALQESISIESTPEMAVITADNEYALDHQEGNESTNLPARPFFPIINGEATAYTTEQCLEAAQSEDHRIQQDTLARTWRQDVA